MHAKDYIVTLNLDRYCERNMHISILSKKFRIMMYIFAMPGCSIKDAQAESGLSYRGFHMKLKEMLDSGLVVLDEDPSDGRKKRLNLGPNGLITSQFFQSNPLTGLPLGLDAAGADQGQRVAA